MAKKNFQRTFHEWEVLETLEEEMAVILSRLYGKLILERQQSWILYCYAHDFRLQVFPIVKQGVRKRAWKIERKSK